MLTAPLQLGRKLSVEERDRDTSSIGTLLPPWLGGVLLNAFPEAVEIYPPI